MNCYGHRQEMPVEQQAQQLRSEPLARYWGSSGVSHGLRRCRPPTPGCQYRRGVIPGDWEMYTENKERILQAGVIRDTVLRRPIAVRVPERQLGRGSWSPRD